MREELELNRDHWDNAAEIHTRGNVYGLEDFKAGKCQLQRIEVEELGPEVAGKSLLHLQCHFGLDTLSWARRGATVTGVDFSPKAIEIAKKLSAETSVPARFICCNLYDLPRHLTEFASFDIVFTSIGVICWLPDLTPWAQLIARYLKPGGIFYILEAHPFARVFPMEEDVQNGATTLRPAFNYFHNPAGTYWPPNPDYSDPTVTNAVGDHDWQHSISDVINSLINAGLTIEYLHEHPVCAWKVIEGAEIVETFSSASRYYGLPKNLPSLPLMFSIRARKS